MAKCSNCGEDMGYGRRVAMTGPEAAMSNATDKALNQLHITHPPRTPIELLAKLGFMAATAGAKYAFSKLYYCKKCKRYERKWFED